MLEKVKPFPRGAWRLQWSANPLSSRWSRVIPNLSRLDLMAGKQER